MPTQPAPPTGTAPRRAADTDGAPAAAAVGVVVALRATARSDGRVVALGVASALVAIPYLLSLASPLRLQPDSVATSRSRTGSPWRPATRPTRLATRRC